MAALTTSAPTTGLRRPALSRWGLAFGVVGIAGIALRVWIYRGALGVPDSDEGVVGLMVRHVLDGQFTTFFWGQAYGGTQEVLLTAPVFALFGSSWVALRIVPILLSAAAALIVWRVGKRTIGEPAAAFAGAVYWIWPPFVLYKLTHQWGFYGSGVVYCGLLILLALRIVERPDRVRVGLFGLVFGLAFWQTTQLVPVVLPLIAWTIWKAPRALRQLWVAVTFAVLGALPWIVYNLRHDWGSLHSQIADTTTYQHRLRIFVSPLLPMMLGLRSPGNAERLLPGPLAPLTNLIYLALLALFVYGAWRTRRRPVSVLYVIAAVFPFIYAIAPQTLYEENPVYIVIVTPVLTLLLAQAATTYWRGVAVLGLAFALSAVTLHRMVGQFPGPNEPPEAPRNLAPLVSKLDRLGLDRVYANFWLAYALTFDTGERIVAVQNKFRHVALVDGQATPADDPFVRWPEFEREVKAARHGFVFFKEGIRGVPIIAPLERYGYRRYEVGRFVVYAPPVP